MPGAVRDWTAPSTRVTLLRGWARLVPTPWKLGATCSITRLGPPDRRISRLRRPGSGVLPRTHPSDPDRSRLVALGARKPASRRRLGAIVAPEAAGLNWFGPSFRSSISNRCEVVRGRTRRGGDDIERKIHVGRRRDACRLDREERFQRGGSSAWSVASPPRKAIRKVGRSSERAMARSPPAGSSPSSRGGGTGRLRCSRSFAVRVAGVRQGAYGRSRSVFHQ